MGKQIYEFLTLHRQTIENALSEYLPISSQKGTERYNDALHYVMFPGGKRWRPLLTLMAGSVVKAQPSSLLALACAMEYLHTSSMIIDDLPAMDDADLRRGKPSVHLAYDECTALLVSLALMNKAYALLGVACQQQQNANAAARLLAEASACIGEEGMIGGQVVDLEIGDSYFAQDCLTSRNLKTSALMRLMMTAGAIVQGCSENEIHALASFGESLGMAYQICDDLLDELGDYHALGKPAKQDARHCRSNFVTQYGIEGAMNLAQQYVLQGEEKLQQQFGITQPVLILCEAAKSITDLSTINKNMQLELLTAS